MFSSLQPHGPAACQATLSITNFQSLLKLMSTKLAAAAAKSLQSCLTLCDPRDGNPPGSPVPGILLARTLEWVAMLSSRDLPDPGVKPVSLTSPAPAGRFFTTSTTWRRRRWHPTPVLLPGESHGRRSLVGCSPWGR